MNKGKALSLTNKMDLINYSIKGLGLRIIPNNKMNSKDTQIAEKANYYVYRHQEKELDKLVYSTNYFWDLKNYLRYHGAEISML